MPTPCKSISPNRRSGRSRLWILLGTVLVAALSCGSAMAGPRDSAAAAYAAGDYTRAARLYLDLAVHQDPVAQFRLGYMYFHGQGVPQNHYVAALWYRCAAGKGYPHAAYMLGLQYDKGQGVPQDFVLAYTWLDLAVANSHRQRYSSYWVNTRNAVASKLTLNERLKAQELALMGPAPHVCEPLGLAGD
jgi:TPR repeat protein